MRAVAATGEVDLTMVSPIGLPPWPLSRSERYRRLDEMPERSESGGVPALHPRFTLIPKIGGDTNPARIAKALLPLARRLHAADPVDLVDAQVFLPDGPVTPI